jgi:uncharacterized protein YfdQ (DUF2303 family)
MNEDNISNAAAMFEASKTVHEPAVHVVTRGDANEAPLLVIPDGMTVIDTKPYLDALRVVPERVKGTSVHQTIESLVSHVQRSKDEDSAAWLTSNATAARLTVVYDYDRQQLPGLDADNPRARWREHQAVYDFPVSDAWKFWQGISGKAMVQSDLAALLEARVTELKGPDAAGPRVWEIARTLASADDDENPVEVEARARALIATPAQLLRFSRQIALHVETRAEESRDDQGNVSIVFRSEATAEDARGPERGKVRLPSLLVIEVPVLQGGALYRLPVRLTTKVQGQRATWTLTVHRADLAFEDAVKDAAGSFSTQTGVTVFRGAPEK